MSNSVISEYQARKKAYHVAAKALEEYLENEKAHDVLEKENIDYDQMMFVLDAMDNLVVEFKKQGRQFKKPEISREQMARWNALIQSHVSTRVLAESPTIKETMYALCWMEDQLKRLNIKQENITSVMNYLSTYWNKQMNEYISDKIRFWEDANNVVERYEKGEKPHVDFEKEKNREFIEAAMDDIMKKLDQYNIHGDKGFPGSDEPPQFPEF